LHLQGWTAAILLLASFPAFYVMQAPWVATFTEVFQGEKAALAIAAINMLGITGGFLGPYWMGWMREQTGGFAVGLRLLCVPWLLMALGLAWATRPLGQTATSADKQSMNSEPEPAN
jgi:ACS family tartrate transporter-like MFS transporter